jgi:hypothetical protein
MGQPVAVTERPSSSPGIVRFELNRTLTGMGHERFASADEAGGNDPAAVLARRLFATGQVAGVHVYSNIVTVDVGADGTTNGLADIVRDLYQYWKPGMEPPSFADVEAPAEESAAAAPAGGDGASDAALSEAAKRVPAHLLERSRAARERWKAKQGG